MRHTKFTKEDFIPKLVNDNLDIDLMGLLKTPHKRNIFCLHKWVYWSLGKATQARRVCEKCYKKQQDRDVVTGHHKPLWVREIYY